MFLGRTICVAKLSLPVARPCVRRALSGTTATRNSSLSKLFEDKIAANKTQQSAMSTSAAPAAGAHEYASTCVIPTEWMDLPLIRKKEVTANTKQFTFSTPAGKPLALPTCACILVKGVDSEGEDAVRPYTPVTQSTAGEFDLLVKVYDQGKCSKYLDGLSIGDKVAMKHIKFNIKIQYPFNKKSVTMICGGTGVTPMHQALDLLINTPGDDTKITMLYGNATPPDILMRDELAALEKASGGRLKVVHVVGTKANQEPIPGWDGELGWVDRAKVEKHAFPPSDDTIVFVCGVPAMYQGMCGPRNEPEVKEGTILHSLGYTDDMVSKF